MGPGKDGEQGAALMIAMTLVLTAGLSLAMDAMLVYGKRVRADKRAVTTLAGVKKSLIAYAAIQGGGVSGLPCAFDGTLQNYEDFSSYAGGVGCGNTTNADIGFLPWQAMQLPPLRDGSHAPIWYAVSATSGDSCGLTINGAGNYAAILFAPGKSLSSQNRDPTKTPSDLQDDFLDGANATTPNAFILSGVISDTYNDRVLGVTCGEIPP